MKTMHLVLAAVMLLACLPAGADTVTVMPDPQPTDTPVGQIGLGETTLTNGWSIVTNAKGWAKLCSYGPSTYQSRTGPFFAHYLDWYNDVWHGDTDFGRGAFYATTDMFKATAPIMQNDWTPSTTWLGTGTWKGASVAGRTLNSIDKMEYFSFGGKTPSRYEGKKTELEWWGKASYMRGPQQPIQLQLTVQSPDLSQKRQLWYRPWGYNFVGDDGLTEPGSQKGRWQWFNCLVARPGGEGKWYMPQTGSSASTTELGWDTWDEMKLAQLPDGTPALGSWVVADPANIVKSPGWNAQTVPTGCVNSNGTGKPINFFLGARVSRVNAIVDDYGQTTSDASLFLQGTNISWVNHTHGARAQVDHFTLGFSGEGTETYDFEPPSNDPAAHIMTASHRSLDLLRSPTMFAANQWNGNLYRVTGRVAAQLDSVNQYFLLEDGSMLTYTNSGYEPDYIYQTLPGPIRVYLPDDGFRGDPWWISTGDWVTVHGYLEPLRYAFPSPAGYPRDPNSPLCLWTNVSNLIVNP
jgi:hypothetical protein